MTERPYSPETLADRFAAHRHGKSEWFDPHPDILAEIERIKATTP